MAKKPKKSKDLYDWARISLEYGTKQFTISELARRHGCSRGAIQRRIKLENWTQDNSAEVRGVANAKLISEDARYAREKSALADEVAGCHTGAAASSCDEKSEIELAAETRLVVLRDHRKDISRLRQLENKLLTELLGTPLKSYMCNFQGEIFSKEVQIPVTERCQAINNLSSATNKRINLERIAFNLNDKEDDDSKDLATVILHDPGAGDEEES